jgi:hypothetical protein
MNPRIWGRGLWLVVFCIIYKHKSDLEYVKRAVYTLCTNLPCRTCNRHYSEHVEKSGILNCETIDEFLQFHIKLYNDHHEYKISEDK